MMYLSYPTSGKDWGFKSLISMPVISAQSSRYQDTPVLKDFHSVLQPTRLSDLIETGNLILNEILDETNFPDTERLGKRGPTFKYPEWLIMFIAILTVKHQIPFSKSNRCWQYRIRFYYLIGQIVITSSQFFFILTIKYYSI